MEPSSRLEEHVRVIRALADGVDPFTGEELDQGNLYQHPAVVRALMAVVHEVELASTGPPQRKRSGARPTNAGKPWSDEDDGKLAASFDEGTSIADLATTHGRSSGAIRARLHQLGRLDDDEVGRRRFATRPTGQGC